MHALIFLPSYIGWFNFLFKLWNLPYIPYWPRLEEVSYVTIKGLKSMHTKRNEDYFYEGTFHTYAYYLISHYISHETISFIHHFLSQLSHVSHSNNLKFRVLSLSTVNFDKKNWFICTWYIKWFITNIMLLHCKKQLY